MIEDQRPGQAATVSHTGRRKNPRTPIRRLAYVNLEPYDNGGVITDISREGLRFHMVNPVDQGGLVRLSMLLGGNQIQAVGELIWMDATRKIGGVRFTVLPDGAAEQILNWAQAPNSGNASNSGVSPRNGGIHDRSIPNEGPNQGLNHASPEPEAAAIPDNASATSTAKQSSPPHATPAQAGPEPGTRSAWVPPSARSSAGAVGQTRPQDLHNTGTPFPQPWVRPGGDQQPSAMPWITHFDPDPPARSSIFVRGVVGGIILCALLGSAAWFGLRQHVWQNSPISISSPLASDPVTSSPVPGGPLASQPALPPADVTDPGTGSANSYAVEPKSAAAPPASASPQRPSPQAPSAEPAPATTLSAKSGSPEPAPQQIGKAPASQPPLAADAGESQLMLARQYLDGHAHPRNPTVASQLLWSAVEKGNSAAEMDLADLYLRGDGVARNCDQARVLLSVASGKGNTEAMQKLSELNRTGCR
jgi:PilZ domain